MRTRRLALLLSLLAPAVAAEPPPGAAKATESDPFERANQAYLHGDAKAAIDGYEHVLAAGVIHEDLHYNLANAYFRAGRLGPAIFHYERALALDPSQDDAEQNLKVARETIDARFQDQLRGEDKEPLWIRLLSPFTLGGLTLAFFALYGGLFVLAFAVYFLRPGFVRLAASVTLAFVVLGTAGTGTLLGGRWWLDRRVERCIVLPDELAVKEGPDASYQTSFLVHAGMRVRVTGHDQDWVKIRLLNGLEGWARTRELGRL